MRILIVCAAGASSTFVAQRVARAARAAGRNVTAQATPGSSLADSLPNADVVLLGPHMSAELDSVTKQARAHGAAVAALPSDVFSDRDGTRTLAFVDTLVAGAATDSKGIPHE